MAKQNRKQKKTNLVNKKSYIILFFTIVALATFAIIIVNVKYSEPNPKSEKLMNLRASTKALNEETIKSILTSEMTLLGSSYHDKCYDGQNNSKVHDGYNHRCTLRTTRIFAYQGDFRRLLIDLEKLLTDENWQSAKTDSISNILANYYDRNYFNTDPKFLDRFNGRYLLSDMPTPGSYSKNGQIIDISYGEKSEKGATRLHYSQNIQYSYYSEYNIENFINFAQFMEWVKSNKYVLTISVEKNYFEN